MKHCPFCEILSQIEGGFQSLGITTTCILLIRIFSYAYWLYLQDIKKFHRNFWVKPRHHILEFYTVKPLESWRWPRRVYTNVRRQVVIKVYLFVCLFVCLEKSHKTNSPNSIYETSQTLTWNPNKDSTREKNPMSVVPVNATQESTRNAVQWYRRI